MFRLSKGFDVHLKPESYDRYPRYILSRDMMRKYAPDLAPDGSGVKDYVGEGELCCLEYHEKMVIGGRTQPTVLVKKPGPIENYYYYLPKQLFQPGSVAFIEMVVAQKSKAF